MYFLEQLATEWYQYQGYFVRTNIKFGKRSKGGYTGEMDVVAFRPDNTELIHIEASTDSYKWSKRVKRFRKKFQDARRYYAQEFPFLKNSNISAKRVALVSFHRPREAIRFGLGIELIIIPDFISRISKQLRSMHPMRAAVPETYPILRAIQFASWYGVGNSKERK